MSVPHSALQHSPGSLSAIRQEKEMKLLFIDTIVYVEYPGESKKQLLK